MKTWGVRAAITHLHPEEKTKSSLGKVKGIGDRNDTRS
jgi:hypothetical protein